MQHFTSLDQVNLPDSWLTIGSFDGVHRGHQSLIQHLVENAHANGSQAAVLTFFPHPAAVLRNRQEAFYLTEPGERVELLSKLGVDQVITQPFTIELANTSAHDFMALVSKHLHPSRLVVGYDFALGHKREGDVEMLASLGKKFGYQIDVIQPFVNNGETVSSSQVRAALARGDVSKAANLLGRPHQLSGKVIHGDGRGRLLGIPTANLQIWEWKVVPHAGVYACWAYLDGQAWKAVTNIGFRPTFENQPVSMQVETHLLDFNRDLYDSTLQLQFFERLRDEQRFKDIEALVAQISQDIERAKQILTV